MFLHSVAFYSVGSDITCAITIVTDCSITDVDTDSTISRCRRFPDASPQAILSLAHGSIPYEERSRLIRIWILFVQKRRPVVILSLHLYTIGNNYRTNNPSWRPILYLSTVHSMKVCLFSNQHQQQRQYGYHTSKPPVISKISWWRHQMETFSALLALCAGNSPVPMNSPHKGQWRGVSMFSLICA